MATVNTTDNLTAVFEVRYKAAWDVYFSGKHEQAERMAATLLDEPQLGPAHQASMHLMLARSRSSNNFLSHAREAFRLYTEILAEYSATSTAAQQASMEGAVKLATDALNDALEDQKSIDSEVDELLASGKTMADLHDARSEELYQQELERERMMGVSHGDLDEDDESDSQHPYLSGPTHAQDSRLESQGSGPSKS
ncbi:hypothetical protein LX32DRAFT_636290 [Colletotrichum zoysiae]|uniref:Uncharacterized protein n=1 Tax=Colletotrichum zoysiae TaxID=1216348 RepID=A0AAD9HNJ2_9PEZI|nr:hypothetical protein LX32DRAFT_636290 [Colletotrichum zoysiae]